MRYFNSGFDKNVEIFLQNAITALDDVVPNISQLDRSIIFTILGDLEKYVGHVISNNLDNLNSYQKISNFVKDVYDAYKADENIYGVEYWVVGRNDFSYRVALDMIRPVGSLLDTYERKDLSLVTKRELYANIDDIDGIDFELLKWDRPVAQVADDKILVATYINK